MPIVLPALNAATPGRGGLLLRCALAAPLLLLGGCTGNGVRPPPAPLPQAATASEGSEGSDFVPRLRVPGQAHALQLQLDKPPGRFAVVQALAQYDVGNAAQCGRIHPDSGQAGRITRMIDLPLQRTGQAGYRGVVHLQLLRDQDYFGRGVCHWQFSGVRVRLKATGAAHETRFLAYLDAAELMAGKQVSRYYLAGDYPAVADIPDYPASGEADPAAYLPHLRAQVFSLSLSASELQP